MADDPRISFVLPFENRGGFVGTSLPHPHGQIYAFGDLPPVIERQMKNAQSTRLFENLDSDGDGAITKSEAEAAGAARFAAADANGDGLLTADEMAAAAQNRQAERIAKRIEKLDANGDGALSLEEMSAKGSKRLAHMFDRLDADGDGVITKAEAEAAKGMRRGKHQRGGDNNE